MESVRVDIDFSSSIGIGIVIIIAVNLVRLGTLGVRSKYRADGSWRGLRTPEELGAPGLKVPRSDRTPCSLFFSSSEI
jgi:hypothetical protein